MAHRRGVVGAIVAGDAGAEVRSGHDGIAGIGVRRGRGEPVAITRGVGGAGSGVNTVVGATCGALGSYGGSARNDVVPPNVSASVFDRPSQRTSPPKQRASGASGTSAGSLRGTARAVHVRSPRATTYVPSPAASTRSAKRTTTSSGPTTCPSRSTAAGALGAKVPFTTTITSAASAEAG